VFAGGGEAFWHTNRKGGPCCSRERSQFKKKKQAQNEKQCREGCVPKEKKEGGETNAYVRGGERKKAPAVARSFLGGRGEKKGRRFSKPEKGGKKKARVKAPRGEFVEKGRGKGKKEKKNAPARGLKYRGRDPKRKKGGCQKEKKNTGSCFARRGRKGGKKLCDGE